MRQGRPTRLTALRKKVAETEASLAAMRAEIADLERSIAAAKVVTCAQCGTTWERPRINGVVPKRCPDCTEAHIREQQRLRARDRLAEASAENKERHRIANRERMRARRQSDDALRKREALAKRLSRQAGS